ncbi:MAG TPA: helix-turn-helix domain-containing protein [Polyangiaceae bacterium]|nr:helix-turn-helix domain-containing protein [Polyangiaceae bacterium]
MASVPPPLPLHKRRERARILDMLWRYGWNRRRAAEALGIPRRTFYRRLDEYGIQPAGTSGRRPRRRPRGPGKA